MAQCNIGLIGAGTVGGGVAKILHKQEFFFSSELGLTIKLKRIVDKQTSRFETLPVGDAICTDNADDIISDPDIHVVVELIGGTTIAKELVLKALSAKKHVVTANKALIAEHGPEIFEVAEKNGVSIYFEASVGGGMPTIKTIRESMVANDILSLKTIINGTCNYILTEMEVNRLTFDDALHLAQKNGFAEADPTLDIGGGDTGHKVAIMASLLYGGYVPYESLPIEGITSITADDIEYADELGYRIKLLGVIKSSGPGKPLDVRVHPAMLKKDHILASVSSEFNAVLLEGDAVGPILLYGKGAGELPTASAVVGDIVDVARNITGNTPVRIPMDFYVQSNQKKLRSTADVVLRYYLRFTVPDRPKILSQIASVLGDHGISIASLVQPESSGDDVPVVMLTHAARERNLQKAIAEIEEMPDVVRDKTQIIRIED
ncbi:MAG: homoserine dehydrogenase [Chitinivibrionales bacterium]